MECKLLHNFLAPTKHLLCLGMVLDIISLQLHNTTHHLCLATRLLDIISLQLHLYLATLFTYRYKYSVHLHQVS